MTDQDPRAAAPGKRWGWIVLALVAGLLVLLLTGLHHGVCNDSSDPALSSCESGPVLGVAGTWLAWIAYALFLGFCAWRVARRR
ncbi:hypothetical protein [Microbacterium stercoris]|uniref:Uncharacterized protein n=1 Tax=Microbacterium stercoris TaxID=2820289 RepID=A0A939QFW9_9MICO|nr:hypothetical protein [Microbacterium stercoris]MBO3662167.1 hypothetical protein [Microbacterium stercoris]